MTLRVFEADRALHFVSTSYFWRWRGVRIPLPTLLTPGVAHVIHADEGAERFSFTLMFTHKLLGRTIYQHGVFTERTEVTGQCTSHSF